ncbi:Inositol 2-dehydrogenase [Caulifigura coniformis]|uniref:Inositol 2-dehydrogenase n=1 Tax=Caulifigura coniformis TaxID=2527983 RepID=A0A517SHW0_9PLAN|nr:Gfo/Idh/MocA family oxidoreductase [Caulifigura coniformis]QDT55709.1 Inositol 2-dehydrogenase [Caulifigura coniformis]
MSEPSRRTFLKTAGAAVAASQIYPTAPASAAGANERIRIGFIGPGGRGFGAHVKTLAKHKNDGMNIELASVCDVWSVQRDKVASYIKETNGNEPSKFVDYRDMLADGKVDAVAIGTPDHWHHKQIVDSLKAGKHVYCEKPMTKQVEEALDVVKAWEASGKVMQVGVQATSQPVWTEAGDMLRAGKLGKVLMYQTEYNRNSWMGQWRDYALTKDMTPQSIDWKRWLGTEEGLAPDMPFDREVYKQWRRFWTFGSGMFTDLFVHRVTMMLKATGLGYPARVVGAGGIYLEYDGRDVPDVATVAADYPEGVHGLVSSTMCNQETRIQQCIRGHFGSFVFSGDSFEFIPERPQITKDSKIKGETFNAKPCPNHDVVHFKNWVDAMQANDPRMVNNDPALGAAAVSTVILGARSYREGKVFHLDPKTGIGSGDGSWAKLWEKRSEQRGKPNHIPGWTAGDYGSTIEDQPHMSLAGPWVNGQPPQGG